MSAERLLRRTGYVLVALAALGDPAAFWWWALLGMTEEVGGAVYVTIAVLGLAGGGMVIHAKDVAKEKEKG